MKRWLAVAFRGLLPVLVLVGGIAGARVLVATKPEPPKKPRAERAVLVETVEVQRVSRAVTVEASGTVTAAYEVEVAAEVGGRVTWKHPQLTTGGLVREGEILLRVDPRDYKLALEQQRAALERAQTELALERGRQRVAAEEWKRFGEGQAGGSKELALREPQHKAAQLGLETAQSGLEQAKLKLGRTVIKAPFDAVVRTNSAEEGRLVSPGQSLATLTNTKLFMVVVSVPLGDLAWLKVPGSGAPLLTDEKIKAAWASDDPAAAFRELSSMATITQEAGNGVIEREGVVVRLLGDLDPAGRMARLLVAVRDPLGRDREQSESGVAGLPILLGAYVKVAIEGRRVENAVEVPRIALREGNKVYLMSDAGRLEDREVELLHRGQDSVLVSSGLTAGERVITSALASPVVGMDLRTEDSKAGDVEGAAGVSPRAEAELPEKKAAGERAP